MKRRSFVKNAALTTSAVLVTGQLAAKNITSHSRHSYNLKYAPHLGMFKHHAGDDPVDQLRFMADEGFTAFEDNSMKKRSLETQKAMATIMEKRGIEMGVFVAHKIYWKEPNLASGKKEGLAEFLADINSSIEVAKRVNAKWITVVPGHLDLRLQMGYQTANVIEALKRAAAILEPHNIIMVLEPLNFYNHPGLFLTEIPQAFQICKAVDSPSCKILFDIYHQQIQEGNLIPNIKLAWDEIAYFQIGDNPGRKEPTTGEINYKNIFKHIHSKQFKGILGMEHGNFFEGKAGERKLIDAYKEVDGFV